MCTQYDLTMSGRTPQSIQFNRVADLYDIYVRTDFDIPFWLNQTRSVRGKVLELACGTGRVSLPLLEAGVNLSCVDCAPEMLAQFRRKLKERDLSCPVYCQDIVQLNLPDRFDLIFIPFHSFSEITDRQRQRLALKQILSHLAEEGRFICTLQNRIVRTSTMDGAMRLIGEFPLPEGGLLNVSARMAFDPSTHIASGEQVYEQFSPEKVLLDRRVLGVDFYLFDRHDFESLLSESGFSVYALYGDYERHLFEGGTSPFMIWTLRRSATGRTG
jgi:SAM-dependent methyltransferase